MRSLCLILVVASLFPFRPALHAQENSPAAVNLVDELVPAIWQKLKAGKSREALAHSRRLLVEDMDNALACATLIDAGAVTEDEPALSLGRRGLRTAAQLRRPRGMDEEEYAQMMKRVRLVLNTAVGNAYMERGDVVTARRYLKEAVALAPGNAQNAYAAARAYLEGRNADPQTGYWLLARTVVLTQGSPAGEQIAKYAEQRFRSGGGTEERWRDYLAVAAAGAPTVRSAAESELARAKPLAPDLPTAEAAANNTSAASTRAQSGMSRGNASAAGAQHAPTSPAVSAAATPAPAASPIDEQTSSRTQSPTATAPARAATQPSVPDQRTRASAEAPDRSDIDRIARSLPQSANDNPPDLPPEMAENIPPQIPSPEMRRPELSADAPISLGVLIEASVASKENRTSVIYALSDMLRHLRENDEAFIVGYGQNVGIEQDLTWNYELLEKAMDRIDRKPGAALLEAVAFSAGHLARIARNPNRVLLVISDGTNEVGSTNPLEHAAEIRASGARIYCIGVGVPGSEERNRLQELAARTGGHATFVEGPNGFRSATHTVAANLGIEFPE
jgi:hypothetical protein